jgi:hypothetical protein
MNSEASYFYYRDFPNENKPWNSLQGPAINASQRLRYFKSLNRIYQDGKNTRMVISQSAFSKCQY